MRRLIPASWRTFTLTDAVVIFGFLLWHVIGANSSDDGYILGMARVADHAGYMSNYFRWFGSPEDPFGWYYNLLALMTHVSDASLWMRLPDLAAGLVCWLLLSREVLPRLGPAVEASKPAYWAAAMVLLTAWMPFNNGLRPEGIIALGSLVTYVLIERSMRYSRLTPAALAVVTAAFTLGVQPTGLIAVAALVAGGRPMLRILVRRHRLVGTLPLVSPMLAAGTVILTVVFADQTLSTVLEATRVRAKIGPSQAWYTENLRYYYLILPTVDGSLSRRFGFLITALAPVHRGVHHVAAQANSQRGPRTGVAADGRHLRHHVLPDVHAHQVGAPLRAVRRRRGGDGRADDGVGIPIGAALVAQPDGVPGGVILPAGVVLGHHQRLVVCLQLRCAVQQRDAEDRRDHSQHNLFRPVCDRRRLCGLAALRARGAGEGRLIRALTTAPVPIVAGFMAAVFVASMVAGIVRQYPTYSNGWSNVRAFVGGCGLADDVLVEPDTNAGFMKPLDGDSGSWGPWARWVESTRSASRPTAYRNTRWPRRS